MTPNGLYSLPPGVDFAAETARGLVERFRGQPPEALAQATVFANSGRTLIALRERLVQSGPLLLPRLRLIGELGEGPLAPALARELDLGALIAGLVTAQAGLAAGQAVPALARSLAALMEEMQREGCTPAALDRIDVAEHAEHWRLAHGFLRIAADWYLTDPPQDRAARQRAAAEAALRDWTRGLNLPEGPVIVAGSTGSQGATRLFLQAVASLPQGAVILPGFDPHQPTDALGGADDGDDHPQARFAPLVARFGQPLPWTDTPPAAPARNRLVSLALRPAPVTDRWIAEGPALGDLLPATEALTLIEAPDPQAEAEALALVIRDAVGRGEPVTLIAADRLLTRRVTAALDRWRLIPDDSAGEPLSLTPPGLLLRQTADLFGQPLMLDSLIALLKHPLTASGWDTGGGDHLRLTRDLELDLRRHGPAFPDAAFLRRWPQERRARQRQADAPDPLREAWVAWLAGWLEAAAPAARDRAARPLPARLAEHLALTEGLAGGPGDVAASRLWQGDDGSLAQAVMGQLSRHGRDRHMLTPGDYAELLLGQLQAQALRSKAEAHPLIRIRGPREARTEAVGLVLLAGLNEGGWPQPPAPDPWLSRQMRRQAGLTLPERLTGLAAHDFQQGIAARTVVLSRAARDADAETVPARWLNRLTNLLTGLAGQNGPQALDAMRRRGQDWLALAAGLAMPVAPVPLAPRPAPVPPAGALRDLSVTQVSRLIRDPYSIYALKVLQLRSLPPLRPEPDEAMRGTVMHEILRRFLSPAPPAGTAPDLLAERFLALARTVLAEEVPWPVERAFWLARLQKIATPLMRDEARRLTEGTPKVVEQAATVDLAGLGVRLTARPDRIDIENDGRVHVYDYKSGAIPTEKEIEAFDKQLPLTAAMLMRGAFASIAAREVAGTSYIQLGGEGKTHARAFSAELAATTWDRLIELVARYQHGGAGFLALAAPQMRAGGGDYDHLSRFGEWSLATQAQPQPVGRGDG